MSEAARPCRACQGCPLNPIALYLSVGRPSLAQADDVHFLTCGRESPAGASFASSQDLPKAQDRMGDGGRLRQTSEMVPGNCRAKQRLCLWCQTCLHSFLLIPKYRIYAKAVRRLNLEIVYFFMTSIPCSHVKNMKHLTMNKDRGQEKQGVEQTLGRKGHQGQGSRDLSQLFKYCCSLRIRLLDHASVPGLSPPPSSGGAVNYIQFQPFS